MKTNDFILQNIGKMVFIDGYNYNELALSYKHIMNKTPLLLIRLCKNGLAHVKDAFHNDYYIKPSAFRLWEGINKQPIPTNYDIMQACINQIEENDFEVGYIDPDFINKPA